MSTPPTLINIECEVGTEEALLQKLRQELNTALDLLERAGSELSVQIVSDRTIQQLHLQYMDDDTPTDVISFEQDLPKKGSYGLLGDIVISKDTAQKQALEKQWSLHEELLYLSLHGILHLLGYDHAQPEEEKIMFGLQDELFKKIFPA